MLNPTIGRWNGVDALADSFLTLSPFAYVGNNPINAIDPDGDSIIVLTAPKGAGGFGHAAVLISDSREGKEGQWRLYSSNGAVSSGSDGGSSGAQSSPDEGTEVGTLAEFWDGEHSRLDGEVYYTEGYLLPSDGATDERMKEAASGTLDSDYAVIGNSCISLCSDALEGGGFDGGSIDPRPNQRYDSIKKNNPGGTIVSNPHYTAPPSLGNAIQDVLLDITRELTRMGQ